MAAKVPMFLAADQNLRQAGRAAHGLIEPTCQDEAAYTHLLACPAEAFQSSGNQGTALVTAEHSDGLVCMGAAFERPYEPAHCIQPGSLAEMIAWVMAAPPDTYVSELSVLPAPQPAGTPQG
jgi:hypothetical protein